jgi:histidinol-phosphate/aromatic aminotransferase/cobyric acid decarboxylase-like protein
VIPDWLECPAGLRLHGDAMVEPGQLDFAVNVVPGGPPTWLRQELRAALDRVAGYPDERPAAEALAARHRRPVGEVVVSNGSADAFWLSAFALRPRRAVVVHPSFTEPEAALRAADYPVGRAWRDPDTFALGPGAVPEDADLVVVGNPNNPTGTLDQAAAVARLARPGRVLVVGEAFMELTGSETESLAGRSDLPGLVVVRSLTKLWGLAGLRAGYLLAPAGIAAVLRAARQPWSDEHAGLRCFGRLGQQASRARRPHRRDSHRSRAAWRRAGCPAGRARLAVGRKLPALGRPRRAGAAGAAGRGGHRCAPRRHLPRPERRPPSRCRPRA